MTPAPDDTHVDVAGMMREVREEVEATTLRDTERIVAVEPWGIEARFIPPAELKAGDAVLESRDVYSYRVTIDLRPVIDPAGPA